MKGKNPVSIPKKYQEILFSIGTYAEKLGTKAWIVGGAVRDFYLGRDTSDIDLSFEGNVYIGYARGTQASNIADQISRKYGDNIFSGTKALPWLFK